MAACLPGDLVRPSLEYFVHLRGRSMPLSCLCAYYGSDCLFESWLFICWEFIPSLLTDVLALFRNITRVKYFSGST